MKTVLTVFFLIFSSIPTNGQEDLSFLILGDWGGEQYPPYKSEIQEQVSKQMSLIANQTDAQFIVALGDNFYKHGVKNEFDRRFNETFVDVYNYPSLQIPWYVIGGNHDHYGNITAEIEYSKASKIWKFPDLWHAHKFLIPGTNNKTIKFVLLDTVVLCGESGLDDENIQPQGPNDHYLSTEQWNWLEQQLQLSYDDYIIVGGHYPVWSVAEHGSTQCLVDRLKPLLEKYHVTAYVCGHDHNLQALKENTSDVNYFVVGAGSICQYNVHHRDTVPKGALKFYWADERHYGGFAHVKVTSQKLTLTFIDGLGGTLKVFDMSPRSYS